MASIFKSSFSLGTLVGMGLTVLSPALQAQGVFQGDTTGTAFGDGSMITGAGLPKSAFVSDFISYEVALSVAEKANKIATAMQTNSFGQNISPEAQQVLLSLFTNPGFDTASALTQKLREVGIPTELARLFSDRLEGLFAPNSSNLQKWQVNSQVRVSGQQLASVVEILNQVIDTADPKALANPPDEFIVIQKVLAELVAATN